jgi:hypothetical protein
LKQPSDLRERRLRRRSTLDQIDRQLDGREISSRLHDRTSPAPIPFGARFRPKKSKPSQSC